MKKIFQENSNTGTTHLLVLCFPKQTVPWSEKKPKEYLISQAKCNCFLKLVHG